MSKKDDRYIVQDYEEWPIHKLYARRGAFVEEVIDYTVAKIQAAKGEELSESLAKTIYNERIRTREEPWKVDPPNETSYWNRLRKKLVKKSLNQEDELAEKTNEALLREIVSRYANEIAGGFNIDTYRFARVFLNNLFQRLLNTASNRNFGRIYSRRQLLLRERFKRHGETELLQKLSTQGTIVLVPTHFSNLDSIMLGWAVDSLGISPMSYGAGLNLYNNKILARFMNRLGAYKLDRRKKNDLYLETLKAFSALSIQQGTHTLFFPGGTRERSGTLERKLKLGLLGTVTEAQRTHLQNGSDEKIFIVPLVISYSFVLEAKKLIGDHLKRTGKEFYHSDTDQLTLWSTLKFMWRLFSAGSEIQLHFGKPMDVMGNFVDETGKSMDKNGVEVNLEDYFMSSNGKIIVDLQREMEYTRRLSEIILDRYYTENIALSSHVVAFTAFNILQHRNPRLDLYSLLRLPPEDRIIEYEEFLAVISQVKKQLEALNKAGRINLSSMILGDAKDLITNGLEKIGIYHPKAPIMLDKDNNIISEDMELLYYYHNRLRGYRLKNTVNWTQETSVAAK